MTDQPVAPVIETVRANLARLIHDRGIPATRLAKRGGIGHRTLTRLLNGELDDVRLSTLAGLARGLGVQVQAFFEGEPPAVRWSDIEPVKGETR